MVKSILGILGLLLLSCSHAATGSDQPSSSLSECTSNADCTAKDPTEFCDFLFPKKSAAGKGSCTHSCTSQNCSASNGEICNPVSGACEPSCSSGNDCVIQNRLGTCISGESNSYCALQTCPASNPLFKASGGFCKLACSDTCPNQQICDAVTGTCEKGCTSSGSECKALTYGTAPNQTVFACSPVTNTCVTQCTVPGGCSGDLPRTQCYAAGYPVGTGTCEKPCAKLTDCGSNLSCAEGVCQPTCSDDSFCKDNPSKRTRCDLITKACAVPCSSSTDCSKIASTLTCSSVSATCVAGCTPGSVLCPSQDLLRAGCLASSIGGSPVNSCEIGCSGQQTDLHGIPPLQGSCQTGQGCVSSNSSAGIRAYCGITCSPSDYNICPVNYLTAACTATGACSL